MAVANVRMRVHSVGGTGVPSISTLAYTGTDIALGSVLVWAGSGLVGLSGANPAAGTIVGVALQAYGTNPGFDAANSPATITGRNTTISVVRPNNSTIFMANLTESSSTIATPAQTDVGVLYGITAYSGIWTIDRGKLSNDTVEVLGFDTTVQLGVVFFRFMDAALSST